MITDTDLELENLVDLDMRESQITFGQETNLEKVNKLYQRQLRQLMDLSTFSILKRKDLEVRSGITLDTSFDTQVNTT